jgi:hypothetical protein
MFTRRAKYGKIDKNDNSSLFGRRIAPTLKITRKCNVEGVWHSLVLPTIVHVTMSLVLPTIVHVTMSLVLPTIVHVTMSLVLPTIVHVTMSLVLRVHRHWFTLMRNVQIFINVRIILYKAMSLLKTPTCFLGQIGQS